MVVNEVTSSVQAKGTKTVVATAVAAMIAGVAGTAVAATGDNVTIAGSLEQEDSTFVVIDQATITGTTNPVVKFDKTTHSLGADSIVTLEGGLLKAQSKTGAAAISVKQLKLGEAKTGTIEAVASKNGGASQTYASGGSFDELNINLSAYNGKLEANAKNASVSFGTDLTLKAGTLTATNTAASDATASGAGTASLGVTGKLVLGEATEYYGDTEQVKTAGTAYDITTVAGTVAAITATDDVTYKKGNVENAGTLTIGSSGSITIQDEVTFANTGVLTLAATQNDKAVNLNAAYEAGETGKLIVNTKTANIGNAITADSVLIGEANEDLSKEKNQVIFNAATTTNVTEDGSIDAGTLTVVKAFDLAYGSSVKADKLDLQNSTAKMEVKGELVAGATNVAKTSNLQITDTSTIAGNLKLASVDLGDVTVGTLAGNDSVEDAAVFTLTGASKSVAIAKSLTVAKKATQGTVGKLGGNGQFVLAGGQLSVGELTNQNSITIGATAFGAPAVLTLTGESTNAGTITFVTETVSGSNYDLNKLVIAKGASLTNSGDITTANTAVVSNVIEVNGTLVNEFTPKTDAANAKGGLIKANKLIIGKDGVVETTLEQIRDTPVDAYQVANTEVAGTFKTALNAQLEAGESKPINALALKTNFDVKDGGHIVAGEADVANYILTGGALTIEGEQALGTVRADTGAFTVTGKKAVVTVENLEVGTANDVSVSGGADLTVGTVKAGTDKKIVVEGSTVSSTKLGLGVKVNTTSTNQALVADTTTSGAGTIGSAAADAKVQLKDQDSVLKVTDLAATDVIDIAKVGESKATLITNDSKGLLDLGDVTIKDLFNDDGVVTKAKAASMAGVTTTALAGATVEGLDTAITASATYGKLTKVGTVDGSLTVSAGTLTLTGADQLVTYQTGTAPNIETKLSEIKLTSADAKVVTTGAGAVLGAVTGSASNGVLAVADGDLTVNGAVAVKALDVATQLTVGKDASGAGYALNASTATIAGKLIADASTVTLGAGSAITGEGTEVKNLSVATGLKITGSATVTNELSAGTGTNAVLVGDKDNAGKLIVKTLKVGHVFADPSWDQEGHSVVAVEKLDSDTVGVQAGRNSVVTIGTTAVDANGQTVGEQVLAASGFTLGDTPTTGDDAVSAAYARTVNSVVYAEGEYIAGDVLANADAAFTTITDGVKIAGNSMLAIDAEKIATDGSKSLFIQAVTLEPGAVVYLDNVQGGDTISLSIAGVSGWDEDNVFFVGDMLMNAEYDTTTKLVEVSMDDEGIAELDLAGLPGIEAAYGMFKNGEHIGNTSASAEFNKWLYTSTTSPAFTKTEEGWDFSLGTLKTVAGEVAALGATTGVQTVTLDAVNMMADTAAARTSILNQKAEGAQVWAEVNGGSFEAKKLFNGAGYSSDIWAGSIGVDYTAACGGTIGAALTIGTADTDSKNTGVKSSTDSDLVGFTVYANKTFNDVLNVAVDLGYLQASNEVSANGYTHSWKFDQDTDAFTFGIRGEVLTKVGGVNIVPHAGLRWTRISTDDFEAGYTTDVASMNVFQLPLGVTVSGEFEAADWTIAPKFDLSVVPAFGDKDAELKLGIAGVSATDDLAVRVVDSNPVQATLGVSATTGAWAFGLNYKLGVGSDSRMNNTFNANVRYAF